MPTEDRAADVVARMNELLDGADLPRPDEIDVFHDEVLFRWNATKTAVVVDLHDHASDGT